MISTISLFLMVKKNTCSNSRIPLIMNSSINLKKLNAAISLVPIVKY